MTDARLARIRSCSSEATQLIAAAMSLAEEDTVRSDEEAKEILALAGLALERFRQLLEAPVLAAPCQHDKASDTIPATSEVA